MTRLCLILAIAAMALAGCALPLKLISVEKAARVEVRPDGTIGPPESARAWQSYVIEMPARQVRRVVAVESTFHLRVTDCRYKEVGRIVGHRINTDGLIGIEDIDVDGRTLNGSSSGSSTLEGYKGRVVRGVAYLRTDRLADVPELCFQASGGSMLGARFKSNLLRVPA